MRLTIMAVLVSVVAAQDPDSAGLRFREAEAAKARGDFPAMATALTAVLALVPGDEYAWRSLAWAEARQGKWEPSVLHAEENVRRHGDTGWTLRQLFDSAGTAGDLALAKSALDRAEKLPSARRDADNVDDRRLFAGWTQPRTYELSWTLPAPTGDAASRPTRWLVPHPAHLWQRCDLSVEGAATSEEAMEDDRRFLTITHRPGLPVILRATVVHTPIVLGAARLAAEEPRPAAPSAAALLGPFKNHAPYDPAHPGVRALVAPLKRKTRAETVQAVLDWLAENLRYEAGYDDALDEILRTHRGVCHHYSNLMVTLCRAAGVPAFVAHGVRLPDAGSFTGHGGSHGWVEVELDTIGWTPVEPLDRNALRRFGGSGYLFFGTSGRGPDDDHFRFTSLQGVVTDGRVR